jgi:hypothetical protein
MGGANETAANGAVELRPTPADGTWVNYTGTFVSPMDTDCSDKCFASFETRFVGSGTVPFFGQKFTLEDAIGSHACSLEALACV